MTVSNVTHEKRRGSIFTGRIYHLAQSAIGPIAYLAFHLALICANAFDQVTTLYLAFLSFGLYTVITGFAAGPILTANAVRKAELLFLVRRILSWAYMIFAWSVPGMLFWILGCAIGITMLRETRRRKLANTETILR